MRPANFQLVSNRPGEPLYIHDVGPWDLHLSVTNDAEGVVRRLIDCGLLQEGRTVYYYDSEGIPDELIVRDGRFAGFGCVEKGDKE